MMTQPIQVDLGQFLQDGFIFLSTDVRLFINFELVICEEHLDSRSLYLVDKMLLDFDQSLA
jgi:hypothetical protein